MDVDESPTATWRQIKYRSAYEQAKSHPFIETIRERAVDHSSFLRWLGQNYIFMKEFIPFVASVLLKSHQDSDESSDMETILGGLGALSHNLCWFKKEASKWEIDLATVTPLTATTDYCSFLQRLTDAETNYTVAVTALWAMETMFSFCLDVDERTPIEASETSRRWGDSDFGQYSKSLQKIADRCLKNASSDLVSKAEVICLTALQHQLQFWNMSYYDESNLNSCFGNI